ncbi:hypothetical protein [Caldiplasma sukawensis]
MNKLLVYSTIFITMASFLLAITVFFKKGISYKFWGSGLFLFVLGAFLEVLFALNISGTLLFSVYLFSVALLVELLALGSLSLLNNKKMLLGFIVYTVLSSLAVIATLIITPASNILVNGVVYGALPLPVVISSSFSTFPSAAILIGVAVYSLKKTGNLKMVWIIAGTVLVSIAGSLYIASFPELLYYSEFLGILFLWAGFFNFSSLVKIRRGDAVEY